MKILITSDWYVPAINGVVASVLNLKKGLEARGHEVKVITLSPTVHSYVDGDVTYIGAINAGKVYPGARLRTAFANPLVRALIEWKPDIVHSNCEMSTFFIAMKIAKRTGAPLVHTYHTVYEDYTHYFSPSKRVGRGVVKRLSKLVADRTDTVIVPSTKVLNILKRYEIETPLKVVPTGIDQDKFSGEAIFDIAEMRRECGIPEGNVVAISIGRLAKEKNLEELISYMKAFAGENVTLLIVGDGPYRDALEKKAGEKGVPRDQIIFYGAVPPPEVSKYYHLGDLFVSASTSETQGLTFFEALSCGLPLLVRQDECLEGVVDPGVNGWEFTDRDDFEEHLRWFIKNKDSHEDMRRAALATGEKFSVAAFAETMEGIYKELLAEGAGGRPVKSRASRLKIHVKAAVRKLKRSPTGRTAGKVVSFIRKHE
ncbi:MAG: glycosyltransferase [Eubacterium sp.]|nr:glycosyltransferase [Eubacterium sp.]